MKKAIIYMLFASFLFALMGGVAKKLSDSIPSVELVFFRSIFSVFFIIILIIKNPISQKGGKLWLLILRGFLGFLGLLAFFYNIVNIPLAEAMTFSRTSPIFTAIFASLFIAEKLSKKAWIYIFIGFIGIIFITKPSNVIFLDKMDYIGILSGVFAGAAYTTIRGLKDYYDAKIIVLSFALFATVGSFILMVISSFVETDYFDFALKEFVFPKNNAWAYIVLLGAFSTMAQIYMTKAYTLIKGGIIGAISYSNILFAMIIGLMFFNSKLPDLITVIGTLLIVFSGIKIVEEK
jgi:drug/metabolite transporter (DMT)-like permease